VKPRARLADSLTYVICLHTNHFTGITKAGRIVLVVLLAYIAGQLPEQEKAEGANTTVFVIPVKETISPVTTLETLLLCLVL
jgi:hypothetical protein